MDSEENNLEVMPLPKSNNHALREGKRMNNMKKALKTILICILAIIVLTISQSIAIVVGQLIVMIGLPQVVEPIIDSILYPILAFFGLKLVAGKRNGFSLKSFRIDKPSIKWYWILTALLLPIIVVFSFFLLNGTWVVNGTSAYNKVVLVLFGVLYYSLAAGIVEEMVFRGIIMGTLEREYNPVVAILMPSILFGAVHIIGNELNVISIAQLVVAGTFVGIMFSLIEYQSGNVWNNAIVHALWNMSTIGICHIGFELDENSLFTLIINTKSTLLSGGDFGIESSLIAIAGYVIISVVAFYMIYKSKNKNVQS